MMDTTEQINANGVNGSDSQAFTASPGRSPVQGQAGTGRHLATGPNRPISSTRRRRQWSRVDNIMVMKCYFKSSPERYGYMSRMHQLWRAEGGYDVSEQRIVDQARVIRRNGLLSALEMEEIKRKIDQREDNDGMNQTEERLELEENVENEIAVQIIETETDERMELSEEQRSVLDRLNQLIEETPTGFRKKGPSLKHLTKEAIRRETSKVNAVIDMVKTNTLEETNNLLYSGGLLVAEKLGAKKERNQGFREPPWKWRIQSKIKDKRKDLSRLEDCKRRGVQYQSYMEKKYRLKAKGVDTVVEQLKQDIIALTAKVKRYSDRIKQFQQNRLFEKDQGRFYENLDQPDRVSVQPDAEDAKEFWQNIWSKEQTHNSDAEWLKVVKTEHEHLNKQEEVNISMETLKDTLKRLSPWKAPGPDGVQGYWVKRFTKLHERLCEQLQKILEQGSPPEWMVKGRTVLILKDPAKGNVASNFRPITCLPIVWKVMTSVLSDRIYTHLEGQSVMPWEQKGCQRRTRATKDQLIVDNGVMKDCKRRKTNLTMGWVDYKKAYDMVPHSWLKECMDIFKVDNQVKTFLERSMNKWNTALECNGQHIGEVKINRGIFQGDSLSPLLFVMAMIPLTTILRRTTPAYSFKNKERINHLLYMDDLKLFGKSKKDLESLMNTVRIYSNDMRMEFGIEKCAVVMLKRGKLSESDDLVIDNYDPIRSINGNSSYKYLGILEGEDVKHQAMKDSTTTEYFRRVRKVLKTKLNSGNITKAINTWAVALFRYGSGVIKWNKQELEAIDRKTRKLLNTYKGVHPRADVDRLYVARREGGRGLMGVEEVVRYEEHSLTKYAENNPDGIMQTVVEYMKETSEESISEFKARQKKTRLDGWQNKIMHGQHVRQTKDQASEDTWMWLTRGSLKRETESLIVAAQDQALATNYRKAKIEKSRQSALCRMCKSKDETVSHIVSECTKMAQTDYKARHDKVAAAVHWSLSKRHNLPHSERWYQHRAEAVVENDDIKLLWDFDIHTDKVIQARRPDIVVVKKRDKECTIIDISVPGDARTESVEDHKIEKYRDLAREVSRLWDVKTTVIPIVIGALGTVTPRLRAYLALLEVDISFETIQKASLLGSARILRKVLEIDN